MISKISNIIVEAQINAKAINNEDRSIYQYGYILAIETLLNMLVGAVVGIVLKSIDTVVIFWMVYIPLRSFCGGWHANKSWQCMIVSNLVLVLVIGLEENVMTEISYIFIVAVVSLFAVFIALMSPVDTQSKKITVDERVRYRRISVIIMVIELAVGLFIRKVQIITFLSYAILTISLLAQKLINSKASKSV